MIITNGLIIDAPHIDSILAGLKTWEMRTSATNIRGRIALIQKGSGTIVGSVNLSDCKGPLSRADLLESVNFHHMRAYRIENGLVDKYKFAWLMRDPKVLPKPLPFEQKSGPVKWVKLDPKVSEALEAA